MQLDLVFAAVKEGRTRTGEIVRATGLELKEVSHCLMQLRREGKLRHNQTNGWGVI